MNLLLSAMHIVMFMLIVLDFVGGLSMGMYALYEGKLDVYGIAGFYVVVVLISLARMFWVFRSWMWLNEDV